MCFGRLQRLLLAVALLGALGAIPAHAGPLAVVANWTDPGTSPGTVSIIDTATDQQVGSPIRVGLNPMAVAITPDGKTAVVACTQSSDLYFIDLSANPPALIGTPLKVGSGSGDTFYPAGLAMAPDGTHVAVTSWTGHGLSTQIGQILVVSLPDRVAGAPVSLETEDPNAGFTAEAAAISQKGAIVIAGPSAKPAPVIYALGYADGEIVLPDPEDNTTQLGAFQGQTGTYVAMSPDGSFAVVPSGGSVLDTFLVGDNGQLAVGKEQISSGGNGAHSAVIAADGKTVYVRNLLPPNDNIAVFQVGTNGDLKDTGQRLTCPGIPQAVIKFLGQAIVPAAGPQMVAVTPDGKKVYATNAYGGTPTAANLFLYGDGNVLVYNAGSAAPIKTLTFGKNPFAIAIQPK